MMDFAAFARRRSADREQMLDLLSLAAGAAAVRYFTRVQTRAQLRSEIRDLLRDLDLRLPPHMRDPADLVAELRRDPALFKRVAVLDPGEFDDFVREVAPAIDSPRARGGRFPEHLAGTIMRVGGRLPKLPVHVRVFNTLRWMRSADVFDGIASRCGWSKSSAAEDIWHCMWAIRNTIYNAEVAWLSAAELERVRGLISPFPDGVAIADGTHQPVRCAGHRAAHLLTVCWGRLCSLWIRWRRSSTQAGTRKITPGECRPCRLQRRGRR
ncbi:MAG: hypothetical protein ACK4ZJ_03895 [Allorhizobium sp.]